jgi:DNA-binding NtrC family response regulator
MSRTGPLCILIVEDEFLLRWSVAEALRAAGHRVIEASSAGSAIAALREPPRIDVILLDYRLPDSDDLTLLASLRRLAPHTPVVMMTAFGTPEMRARARDLGATVVMDKPFDIFGVEEVLFSAWHARPH